MHIAPRVFQRTCRRGLASALLILAIALVGASISRADTLWVKSEAGGRPIAYNNVRITRIAKGDTPEDVYYLLPNGDERNKPLEQIVQMKVDDDLAFTAAEAAFAAGDMKAAAAAYRKVPTSPSKPWLKKRVDARLLLAASQSGDFVDKLDIFVASVLKDPAATGSTRPQIAGASAQDVDAAITKIKKASDGGTSEQKQVLLPFLAELYSAKKDTAAAQRTLAELTKLNPVSTNNADMQKARADVAVGQARDALSQKNYAVVLSTIRANSALLTEPAQQVEALFLIAEAKAATATDDNSIKDAALAYMRVVANFKSMANVPHVVDSLLKSAQLEEKLKDNKGALALYTQLVAEYKDDPTAKVAQERIAQLTPPAK